MKPSGERPLKCEKLVTAVLLCNINWKYDLLQFWAVKIFVVFFHKMLMRFNFKYLQYEKWGFIDWGALVVKIKFETHLRSIQSSKIDYVIQFCPFSSLFKFPNGVAWYLKVTAKRERFNPSSKPTKESPIKLLLSMDLRNFSQINFHNIEISLKGQ